MTVMVEIYYPKPLNFQRENTIGEVIVKNKGVITYRETDSLDTICITAEFDSWEEAHAASAALRTIGGHVEGPCEYG